MHKYYQDFLKLLEKENKEACVEYIIQKLSSEEINIVPLYEEILKPSLNDFVCSSTKDLCIWKEHLRSSIIRTIIECSFPYLINERNKSTSEKSFKKVAVLCPDGEYHEIGARMISDYFTLCGCDSIFIGSNTPKTEFLGVINILKPDFIDISVTNYYNLVAAKKTIQEIKLKSQYKPIILVGGNAFIQNPSAYKEIGADHLLQNYDDIRKFLGR